MFVFVGVFLNFHQPAGPKIALRFLHLLVYIILYIFICASTLITCDLRHIRCCHATLLESTSSI